MIPDATNHQERPVNLPHRLLRAAHDARPTAPAPAPPPADAPRPTPPPAGGLVPHGDPIDIGWIGGTLDARLTLSVRPGMDHDEREQLLAILRDALAPVVPIRRTGQEVSS